MVNTVDMPTATDIKLEISIQAARVARAGVVGQIAVIEARMGNIGTAMHEGRLTADQGSALIEACRSEIVYFRTILEEFASVA